MPAGERPVAGGNRTAVADARPGMADARSMPGEGWDERAAPGAEAINRNHGHSGSGLSPWRAPAGPLPWLMALVEQKSARAAGLLPAAMAAGGGSPPGDWETAPGFAQEAMPWPNPAPGFAQDAMPWPSPAPPPAPYRAPAPLGAGQPAPPGWTVTAGGGAGPDPWWPETGTAPPAAASPGLPWPAAAPAGARPAPGARPTPVELAHLRAQLAEIIRTDALRHGIDLNKER